MRYAVQAKASIRHLSAPHFFSLCELFSGWEKPRKAVYLDDFSNAQKFLQRVFFFVRFVSFAHYWIRVKWTYSHFPEVEMCKTL